MLENVIVKTNNDNTEIEILPFKMMVRFNDDTLEISFEGKENNNICIKGNTKMLIDGDFMIGAQGEMEFANKGNIHLDSVGGKMFWNSRMGQTIKGLPESIEWRRKKAEEYKIQMEINEEEEKRKAIMFSEYMDGIEERIEMLEEKCEV